MTTTINTFITSHRNYRNFLGEGGYKSLGFPGGSVVKNLPTSSGDKRDMGSIPGSRRSPGGRHGNPLQYSCLDNSHGQRSLAGYSPQGHTESDTNDTT